MVVDVAYIWGGLFILNNVVEGFLRPTSIAPPGFRRDIDLCWEVTAGACCCMTAQAHPTFCLYNIWHALFFGTLGYARQQG